MPPGPASFRAKAEDFQSQEQESSGYVDCVLEPRTPGFLWIFFPTAIWPFSQFREYLFPFLNKVHSSGSEFSEKWNGCCEEEKLMVIERHYIRHEATTLLCKDGRTYTHTHTLSPPCKKGRGTSTQNLLQVPQGWNWGKVLRFTFSEIPVLCCGQSHVLSAICIRGCCLSSCINSTDNPCGLFNNLWGVDYLINASFPICKDKLLGSGWGVVC